MIAGFFHLPFMGTMVPGFERLCDEPANTVQVSTPNNAVNSSRLFWHQTRVRYVIAACVEWRAKTLEEQHPRGCRSGAPSSSKAVVHLIGSRPLSSSYFPPTSPCRTPRWTH